MDSHPDEAGIDTCAICLDQIDNDEAFLDHCYHRFHQECVLVWTASQKRYPSASGQLHCPLCKSSYSSVLHSFGDHTFRQEWIVPGKHPRSPSLIMTPEQRRRRAMYFSALVSSDIQQTRRRRSAAVVPASETTAWITRELQAIMLEQDVHLVCQVVLGTAASLAKDLLSTGTRGLQSGCAKSPDLAALDAPQRQHWLASMAAAVSPFLADHADQFAQELLKFLAARLSIIQYDRLIFGEAAAPVQAAAARQAGTQLKQQADLTDGSGLLGSSDSSNASSNHTQDGGSDTDSEGYLSLLQAQQQARMAKSTAARVPDPVSTCNSNSKTCKMADRDMAAPQPSAMPNAMQSLSGTRDTLLHQRNKSKSAQKTLKGIDKHHKRKSRHKS